MEGCAGFLQSLLVIMMYGSKTIKTEAPDSNVYCQTETFSAQCAVDEVIVMKTADYGRMKISRCVARNYGYIGCQKDVLLQADFRCSGRRRCDIAIPEPLFDDTEPCPNDLKSYFEATYDCVKVPPVPDVKCHTSVPEVELSAPSGVIASVITEETSLGSIRCPWVIKVKPGQTIHITLLDFASIGDLPSGCQAYATIREKSYKKTEPVCGQNKREAVVYRSQGPLVEIRVVTRSTGINRHFILKYKAVGCPDPEDPVGGKAKRQGDKATFMCLGSTETWELTCEGTAWTGPHNNCTKGGRSESLFDDVSWGKHTMPFGSSMVIVIAIALTLGILILIIGLSVLKCRKRNIHQRSLPHDHQYQTTYKVPGAVPSRPAQVGIDQESFYQAPENEYAYISDFPQQENLHDQNLSSRHMELYKARKCYDYGTAVNNKACGSHSAKPIPPARQGPSQSAKIKPEAHERYVEKSDRRLVEAQPMATYFELDPDEDTRGSGSSDCNKMAINNNCSIGAHGMESSAMKRVNQSTHDFTPNYDHLVDSGNNNHKSV